MLWQYTKQPAAKRFFPLPNEIFSLGLSPGALAVYSYLLYCEDRKTYQCWPSYRSIGEAVRMSVNTVRKYVSELEEHGLIVTEPTFIITGDGRKHNGTLRYTILPIQKCGGPPQPTTAPTAGGNSRANACPQEAGGTVRNTQRERL